MQMSDSKESFKPYENIISIESNAHLENRHKDFSIDAKRQGGGSISVQSSTKSQSHFLPKLRSKQRSRMINYTYKNKVAMSTDHSYFILEIRNKAKIVKKLNDLNESLSPRFKLSKIDLEDIQNSSVIKAGQWNSQVTESLLRSTKKQERRKLYYKNRVRQIAKRYKSKD